MIEPLENRLAFASAPSLVLDINTLPVSADPAEFVVAGDVAYFAATTAGKGRELWRTDGTAAGTTLVADIEPGETGANPTGLTMLGSTLLFAATKNGDRELWKSDGTAAGTTLVANIEPGATGSVPTDLTVVGSTLFFAATKDGDRELWKSDGTAEGTVLVKNINSYNSSIPEYLVAVGDTLFLAAWGPGGRELWKSDGTDAGTMLVKDLDPTSTWYPGIGLYSRSGYPRDLTAVQGKVFFSAQADSTHRALWMSDGTEAGTAIVAAGDVDPSSLCVSGGKLFFAGSSRWGSRELWVSDGTTSGTAPLVTIDASDFVAFGSGVLFAGNGSVAGSEPWFSDGTADGTRRIADIEGGGRIASAPFGFVVIGGEAFFSADDGIHGRELWKTDGTAAGTSMVRDILLGSRGGMEGSSAFASLATLNGRLLFSADDESGSQLWTSDGTTGGTAPVKRFDEPTLDAFEAPGDGSASFASKAILDGVLYFPADDGVHGTELWRSNGTAAGTRLVGDVTPGAGYAEINILGVGGGRIFFTAKDEVAWDDSFDERVYATDGGAGDPTLLGTGQYRDFALLNGVLFMLDDSGRILRSDGTAAGTVVVDEEAYFNGNLECIGDRVYYPVIIRGEVNDSYSIRSTDAAGDVRIAVASDDPYLANGVGVLLEAFGTLCVAESSWEFGPSGKLLRLGESGLSEVPGIEGFGDRSSLAVGNRLFHVVGTGETQLRVSDGSLGGVQTLLSVPDDEFDWSWVDAMQPWGGGVIFALSQSGGRSLWFSDGSAAGTRALVDGIDAIEGVADGNIVYSVTGADGVGRLFLTDGTTAGTSVVPAVSSRRDTDPGLIGVLGNRLLLAAADDTHGRELFAYSLATAPVEPSGLAVTRGDGKVTLAWAAPASNGGAAITDYLVQRSADAGKTWTTVADGVSTATTATVAGLTNGTSYVFRVAAVNSLGAGAFSANSAPMVPGRVASAPAAPTVTRGDTKVTLSWKAPSSDGGLPITDYVIRWSADQGATWNNFAHPASTSTSITVTGLANGKSHLFRVAAVTAVGRGFLSTESAPIVPGRVEEAPAALTVTRGDTKVTLSWKAPSSDGGLPVTDYVIRWSVDQGATWNTFAHPASTSTSITVTGLANGTSHVFRVAAVTAVGRGFLSTDSAAMVPGRVASAPAAPTVTRGDTKVTLSWKAPSSDGGLPITDYVIRWSVDQGATWNTFAHPASTATSITVTGLANGTSHVFRVAAVTAVSRGFLSTDSAAIVPATVATAPSSLVATRGIGEVVLSWQAPSWNGGVAITDYAILWSDDDGVTWRTFEHTATTGKTATIKGLSTSASYRFRVAAVNAVGRGAFVEVTSSGSVS